MVERTINVFAESHTLGEQHMLNLAIELNCSWNSHSDGGDAWLASSVRETARFVLQIDGSAVPGSLRFKDEGQGCQLVAFENGRTRKEALPKDGPLARFILEFALRAEPREANLDAGFLLARSVGLSA
jgi:hypothetical protein